MVNWEPKRLDGVVFAYEAASATALVGFQTDEVPSCTLRVVRALHAAYDEIVAAKARGVAVTQMVLMSRVDGIFNMGGDLGLMAAASRAGDRAALEEYGRLTASLVHRTWDGLGCAVTTIAAVDGDAFGGGCEAALSANIVVASRKSRFAFPEVRFGLYPAMGATSLVGRRCSPAFAAAWIAGADVVDAEAGAAAGLVDRVVCERTETAVLCFLRGDPARRRRLGEVARLRRLEAGYTREEAERIVLQWADTVAVAPARTLTHIERIVRAQKARMAGSA